MLWIKILHLLGMLMWFGTLMITHGTMARNLASSHSDIRMSFARTFHNLNWRYLLPGLILSLGTGLWLIFAYYGLAATYIRVKLILGLLAAIASLLSIHSFRNVRQMIEKDGPHSPDWRVRFRTWRLYTFLASTFLLIILASAVLKYS